ncbi:MAG: ExbD/TolR family protein [Calditrichia bacterium]
MFKGKPADSRSLITLAQEEQATNDNVIFSVKTSRGTPYQIYIDVVDALKEARAKRISIADPDDI